MLESFYLGDFCISINYKRERKKGTSISSVSGLHQGHLMMKFIQYFPRNDCASAMTDIITLCQQQQKCKLKYPIPIQIFLLNFSTTSFITFSSFFLMLKTPPEGFPMCIMQWKILVQAVGSPSKANHTSR